MPDEKIHPADDVKNPMAPKCPCRKSTWCLSCLFRRNDALEREIGRLRVTPVMVQKDDPIAAYLEANGFGENLLEWGIITTHFRRHGVPMPTRFSLQMFDRSENRACSLSLRWPDGKASMSWMATAGNSRFVPGITVTIEAPKTAYGTGNDSMSRLTPELAARLLAVFLTPESDENKEPKR